MQSIHALLRMFLQVLRNNHNLQWSCLKRPSRNTLHPEEPTGVLVYMSDLGLSVATHHRLDASVSRCICAPLHASVSSLSKVARFSQLVNLTQVTVFSGGDNCFVSGGDIIYFWHLCLLNGRKMTANVSHQSRCCCFFVSSQRGNNLSHLAST